MSLYPRFILLISVCAFSAAHCPAVENELHGVKVHDATDIGIYASEARCESCPTGISKSPGRPQKPKRTMPGDRNSSDKPGRRYCMDDCKRAGNPKSVAPWAVCSTSKRYSVWYVGGGAAFSKIPSLFEKPFLSRGRERKTNAMHDFGEGTWGMDYRGFRGKKNVWLKYNDKRDQGGEGAYETDGEPELVKKVKSWLPFH